jgi:hypothetical protein
MKGIHLSHIGSKTIVFKINIQKCYQRKVHNMKGYRNLNSSYVKVLQT